MKTGMQACLFDLDGTLVDSEPMWGSALRLSLHDINCPLGKKELDELVYGRSWLDIYDGLCQIFPKHCASRTEL